MQHTIRREDALDYHANGRPGKIEVIPTKATSTQRDLTLAYSPGVAEPCLAIAANPDDVFKYTAKGNLVAVISNGTAVLGLGDIGPAASKPVMEGKALLFKIYADIDVFDLELNTKDIDQFVQTVKILEPTFGGINLEDIKAPECFVIEERLKREMNIPVMHDDQHGTLPPPATCETWPRPSPGPMFLWVSRKATSLRPIWSEAWLTTRLCLPWRTPPPKSATKKPSTPGPT